MNNKVSFSTFRLDELQRNTDLAYQNKGDTNAR